MNIKMTKYGGSTESKQYFKEDPKNQSLRIMQSHIFNSDIRGERDHGYIIADSSDNTMYRMIIFESAIDICYLEKIEYDENVAGGSSVSYASAPLSEIFIKMKKYIKNSEIVKAKIKFVQFTDIQKKTITIDEIDRSRYQEEIKTYNINLVNL